ncbi:unnamed protein product [Prunus brigantina]
MSRRLFPGSSSANMTQFSVVWVLLPSRGHYIILTRTFLDGGCVSGKITKLEVALSSLIMIDRVHWINKDKLIKFILDCQDIENGGISDRPDDAVDVYHTYFGVAGLSLLEYPGLKTIDPTYALPVDVVNRIILGR